MSDLKIPDVDSIWVDRHNKPYRVIGVRSERKPDHPEYVKNLYVMYRAIDDEGNVIAFTGVMLRSITAWCYVNKKGVPRYRLATAEELDCA
jgi:hypothetical protein